MEKQELLVQCRFVVAGCATRERRDLLAPCNFVVTIKDTFMKTKTLWTLERTLC